MIGKEKERKIPGGEKKKKPEKLSDGWGARSSLLGIGQGPVGRIEKGSIVRIK